MPDRKVVFFQFGVFSTTGSGSVISGAKKPALRVPPGTEPLNQSKRIPPLTVSRSIVQASCA